MFITAERIVRLAPRAHLATAESLAASINAAAPAFHLTTLLRRAHFMAQACHESAGFTRFEENLNYLSADRITRMWPRLESRAASLVGNRRALANAAYAGKNGNGDEASGDGWKFRGRGPFQITGRKNYVVMGCAIGVDLVAVPDALLSPDTGARAALAYWKMNGCNELADMDDCEGVTRKINGKALVGLAERRELTETAKRIFV